MGGLICQVETKTLVWLHFDGIVNSRFIGDVETYFPAFNRWTSLWEMETGKVRD